MQLGIRVNEDHCAAPPRLRKLHDTWMKVSTHTIVAHTAAHFLDAPLHPSATDPFEAQCQQAWAALAWLRVFRLFATARSLSSAGVRATLPSRIGAKFIQPKLRMRRISCHARTAAHPTGSKKTSPIRFKPLKLTYS